MTGVDGVVVYKVIDPMCLETKTIRTFDRNHHIYYASFKLGFMIWNRDFSWFCVESNLPVFISISSFLSPTPLPINATRWCVGWYICHDR
jgi:hypothetical protein